MAAINEVCASEDYQSTRPDNWDELAATIEANGARACAGSIGVPLKFFGSALTALLILSLASTTRTHTITDMSPSCSFKEECTCVVLARSVQVKLESSL